MNDRVFFDTDIICYAFDLKEPAKREICEKLVKRVMNGEIAAFVSNQILGEVFNASVKKLGLSTDKAKIIVQTMIESEKWHKVDYTYNTINNAVEKFEQSRIPFWDLVIIETMKEHGISEIITENEGHFDRIPGIKVRNPLK